MFNSNDKSINKIISDYLSCEAFFFLVRDRCRKFLHNYELAIVHVNRTFCNLFQADIKQFH